MQTENKMQTSVEEKHTENLHVLEQTDPDDLASYLAREHPQTIVMIIVALSHTGQAARLFNALPEDLKPDITRRMLHLQSIPPGVQVEVVDVIAAALRTQNSNGSLTAGGMQSFIRMLQSAEEKDASTLLASAEAHAEQSTSELLLTVKKTLEKG
ncbi:hypothetical protein KKI24_16930 [bacterium]|nr:hypothetical protein [bacterium]